MTSIRNTGPLLASLEPWLAALLLALAQGVALGLLAGLNNYLDAIPVDAPALVVATLTAIARFVEGLVAQYKVSKS